MPKRFTYYNSSAGYDPDALLLFEAADNLGFTLPTPNKVKYNNTFLALKAANKYTGIMGLWVDAADLTGVAETDRKTITLINMVNPTMISTISNDYAGSHIVNEGYIGLGNIQAFGILTGMNPTTEVLWDEENISISMLILGNQTVNQAYDVFCTNNAVNNFNALMKTRNDDPTDALMVVNRTTTLPTYAVNFNLSNSKSWWRMDSIGLNLHRNYINGALQQEIVDTATVKSSGIVARFGAYANAAWIANFYTTQKQGALIISTYTGDDEISEIVTDNLLSPSSVAYMDKRLYIQSDSIMSGQALGHYSRTGKKVITDLNNHWTLSNRGLINEFAKNIDDNFATLVAPYVRPWFQKDIFWLAMGTNDLTPTVGVLTGAQLYTTLLSIKTKALTAGWNHVVIAGIVDNKMVLGGGGAQATFDTERAVVRTSMLALFTVAHGSIPNYWLHPSDTTMSYFDAYSASNFNNFNSTDFEPADNRHFTTLGSDNYADEGPTLILPTL